MKHYTTISEMHRDSGFPAPEHPLISAYVCKSEVSCSFGQTAFTGDFYIIGFKKMKSGVFRYGRTRYDHDNGTMSFTRPRQVIEARDLQLEEDGFVISFHEDYLVGHPLHAEIRKYRFFDYEVNEALHLSPKEEQIVIDLFRKIEQEYQNNPDEYSREIILAHIDSILKYAQRFYKRQFINRADLSGTTVSKFNEVLSGWSGNDKTQDAGLPTVKAIASQMHMSPDYLSDLLRQETGKTAMELIHIFLIDEAKHLLKGPDSTISKTAYALGFENLPYFSRLFKRQVGLSPNQYKKQLLN